MKHTYLAILVISLYAPQAFSDVGQGVPEPTENITEVSPVEEISSIYSDIRLRMHLATKANVEACRGDSCLQNQAFDDRVKLLGERLSETAYEIYPSLKKRVKNFEFSVAEKKVLGSASNANGSVVIFRRIQDLTLDDEALSFLMAREMGHVIAQHHNDNAKTKLLFTVLTGVLFPAMSIISASSAAAQVSTATTVLTSAASTATSYVGSEVALSTIKPGQLAEADDIAIGLLEYRGNATKSQIAQSLEFIVQNEGADGWEEDLYQSTHYVRQLAGEPKEVLAEVEPIAERNSNSDENIELAIQQAKLENTVNHTGYVQAANQANQPEQLAHKTISKSRKLTGLKKVSFLP